MTNFQTNYQLKKKLDYSKNNDIHYEPEFIYFDLDGKPSSAGSILNNYDLWYVSEKELLNNINIFLGIDETHNSDLHEKLLGIWLRERENYSTNNNFHGRVIREIPEDPAHLTEEHFIPTTFEKIKSELSNNPNKNALQKFEKPLDHFITQINNINILENAQNYHNVIVKETESKILILTKIKPFIMIFKDLSTFIDSSGIPVLIENMQFKAYQRNNKNERRFHSPRTENTFQARITVGKNTCKLSTTDYLSVITFTTEWSRSDQDLVIKLLEDFEIVAITKRDIRLELTPIIPVNISYFFILLDILTSGKNCEHFITHERENVFITHNSSGEIETKKHSFYLDEKKFNFVKPGLNIFIKSDIISSTIEVDYITRMISELLNEFETEKNSILSDYKNRVLISIGKKLDIKEVKKEKKTKQNVDVLRDAEPFIFKNTSYTQKCQKSRQPFIIDTPDTLRKRLEDTLKEPYWRKELDLNDSEEVTIEKILEKYQVDDIKDLTLEFPTKELIELDSETYGKLTPKLYSCLPRKEKDKSHIFPGVLHTTIKNIDGEEIRVPCCFKRKKDTTVNANKKVGFDSYPLGVTRDLYEGRQGFLPQYLGSILSENEYFRKGVKKPNFISILDEVCKNDNRDFNATFINSWKDGLTKRLFYIPKETEEKILKMLDNEKKLIENINLIGFILGKNIILFETHTMYNSVLISPKLINTTISPFFKSFVGIRINSVNGLEAIITKELAYIHQAESEFAQYITFVYSEFNREIITIMNT